VPVLVSAGNASLHGLCVVYTDGSLRCRGVYPGDGTDYSATAATVPGISEATDVWVGDSHTCAVDGGQVKCWGADGVGQLGDRSTANSYVYTPVTVSGIENASQVVAGQAHTCAIDGGAVKCWGDGLGSGTFDTAIDDAPDTFGPFTVPLPAAAARLATGRLRELTCAALVNSETWCWGYDFGVGLDPDDCDAFGVNCAPSLATGLGPSRDYVTVGRTHAVTCQLLRNPALYASARDKPARSKVSIPSSSSTRSRPERTSTVALRPAAMRIVGA
jgi:alpha-tubulin suppressor-like RCC1 family protein